jgi:hypothetical protein
VLDAFAVRLQGFWSRRVSEEPVHAGIGYVPVRAPPKRRRGGGTGAGLGGGRAHGRQQRQLPPTFISPTKARSGLWCGRCKSLTGMSVSV